jgi:integrase
VDLEEQGCSRSLVHHVLTDLRALLRWCEESALIQKVTVPKRWLPKLPERAPDRLTEEEIAAVSAIADPYGFVVRLALGTGLRWGELARLEASDVWQGVIVVRQSKSGKVRRVPVSAALMRELREKRGLLVPFRAAKVLAAGVRRLSGAERFHVHQTRHTFACRYLERGGSLHALQQLLGHSTVLVTQRYARLTDEAVFAECRRIEDKSDLDTKPAQKPAQGD